MGPPTSAETIRSRSGGGLTVVAVGLCAGAAVLGGAVYLNGLHNPFIYDDYRLVVENRSLATPGNVYALLWSDATRPVTTASLAVDRALWGSGPFGFHLTGLLLHGLNVALLATLVWGLTRDAATGSGPARPHVRPEMVAPAVALLFALHPMLSEAVGAVSGRSEVLSSTFFLAGLLAARSWMRRPSTWSLLATFACWGLALGSRETAVAFPLVVFIIDRWLVPGSPQARRDRLVRLHAPLVAATVLVGVARLWVLAFIEATGPAAIDWRIALAVPDTVFLYLRDLLRPTTPSIFHFVPIVETVLDPRVVRGVVTVGGLLGIAWLARTRLPVAAAGLLWFLLLIAPSAVLVVLGRAEPMAEHRVYLASAGLFAAMGVGVALVSARLSRRGWPTRAAAVVCAIGVLVTLAGRTVMRNAQWASPVAVWLEASAQAPDHWLPKLGLAEELHRAGLHAEAASLLGEVTRAVPDEPAAWAKLGVCRAETGDLEGAAAAFSTLQTLAPRSVEAANGLATVSLLRGDPAGARARYLEALAIDQPNIAARRGLAMTSAWQSDRIDAERWCDEIRQLDPGTPDYAACLFDLDRAP